MFVRILSMMLYLPFAFITAHFLLLLRMYASHYIDHWGVKVGRLRNHIDA